MAQIPATASPEVQQAFRELWDAVNRLVGLNTDFQGRRLSGVGDPVQAQDVATKAYVDSRTTPRN